MFGLYRQESDRAKAVIAATSLDTAPADWPQEWLDWRLANLREVMLHVTGVPAYQSASGSDRANVPERVHKDVTYRHVRVDYWLAARVIYPSQADRDGGPLTGIEAGAKQRAAPMTSRSAWSQAS